MSDIYLQITETPTVVTLSAPVISGALSSTVTVANVVTVALDSNSLSALENVTVTVGAAVSISNFPASQVISGTVTANPTGTQTIAGTVTIGAGTAQIGSVTVGALPALTNNTDFAGVGQSIAQGINAYGTIPIAADWQNAVQGIGNLPVNITAGTSRIGVVTIGGGTVTIGAGTAQIGSVTASISGTVPVSGTFWQATQPVSLASVPAHAVTLTSTTVTVSSMPAVSGSVTLGASTAQIGSVTASISGTVPVSGTFYQATQPVSLASLPALVAGTAQIGSVTASISNSVVTFYPLQGTTVSNTNFTSTTASTTLVSAVANREVLTVFNEGAGNLHISPGATCTTIAYQVRLSAGDYWECPAGQLSLAHTAVFATAGTARVCQVS